MKRRRTLLGIFAHPDDESFGPGGTLARYAAEGAAVHVIISTDGIAGSLDGSTRLVGHESLAQVRSAELAQAAVALGITSIWSLPYRDSGMRGTEANGHPNALIRQPVEQITIELLQYINRLQPQVIITHDPYGGYGHPDHIRVCEATTAAFYLARQTKSAKADPDWSGPQKLYYTALPKQLVRLVVRLMPLWGQDPTAFGRNQDINLVEISGWDTPVTARIRVNAHASEKMRASQAHASQYSGGPGWITIIPALLRRRYRDYELFTRVYPHAHDDREVDLFQST